MRVIRPGAVSLLLAMFGSAAPPALAQTTPSPADQSTVAAQAEVARLQQELAEMREQYDARLRALEDKLAVLAASAAPPGAARPPGAKQVADDGDVRIEHLRARDRSGCSRRRRQCGLRTQLGQDLGSVIATEDYRQEVVGR